MKYYIFFLKLFLIFYLEFFYQTIIKSNDSYKHNNKHENSNKLDYNILNDNNELIKIGYYCHAIKFGGIARSISLLINYLSKEKYFEQYLITDTIKLKKEYTLPTTIKRISLSEQNITLFEVIKFKKIDILIYNFFNVDQIEALNKLNEVKTIYYDHSSFLFWIYKDYLELNNVKSLLRGICTTENIVFI